MMLNIELKGPVSDECAAMYDNDLAARTVIALIDRYDIGLKTMVSSFSSNIIKSILQASQPSRKFIIQCLTEFQEDKSKWHDCKGSITGSNMQVEQFHSSLVQ